MNKYLTWILILLLLNVYVEGSPVCEDVCVIPTHVTGVVKYINGTPLQSVYVELYLNGSKVDSAPTNENGIYDFVPVIPPEGAMHVEVKVDVGGIAYSKISTISCGVDKELNVVIGTAESNDENPTKKLTKIIGNLKYLNGSPIKNNVVKVYLDGTYYRSLTTNSSGLFEIELSVEDNKTHKIKIEATIDGKTYSSETTTSGESVINFDIEVNATESKSDGYANRKSSHSNATESKSGGYSGVRSSYSAVSGGAGGGSYVPAGSFIHTEETCPVCKLLTFVSGSVKYTDGTPVDGINVSVYLDNSLSGSVTTNEKGMYILSVENNLCEVGKKEVIVETVVNNKTYSNKSLISCGMKQTINILIPIEECPFKTGIMGEIKYIDETPAKDAKVELYLNRKYIKSKNTDVSGSYFLELNNIYTYKKYTVGIRINVNNNSYSKKEEISCGEIKTVNITNIPVQDKNVHKENISKVHKEQTSEENTNETKIQSSKTSQLEIVLLIFVVIIGAMLIYQALKKRKKF